MSIAFFCPGIPKPKGSMRAFMPKGARFPVVTNDDPKTKSWQSVISVCASQAMRNDPPLAGAVSIAMVFVLLAPKTVKRSRPTTKPDTDKLVRAVLDGLTGICFADDAQVCTLYATKRYGDQPGVHIDLEVIQ